MPCFQVRQWLLILIPVIMISSLWALVPPVPKYTSPPSAWEATYVETNCHAGEKSGSRDLPNNILVLRVQFTDMSFRSTAVYPDYLAHDEAFFDRWMFHLQDFFTDASHGAYKLNYTLFSQVLTLPNPISYYGEDSPEKIDFRLPHILPHIMTLVDDEIDFRNFGGLIIFHAGAGQESDIDRARPNQIWSTFLTRKNLQAAFAPNNDNYPGFTTGDGAILTNVVIVPEDEYQDYFPSEGQENASAYLFSIYGVLAHQFGHVLGLPTLFDNDSSNGKSQGIGNWGLMGTGVWNGNGFVPAQPSAYCRYLLGWETPVVLGHDSMTNTVDHFLNHTAEAVRMYKIPISTNEYFLVENRQQNPDGSLNPLNNQPSYSFKLLPEGEQDYYEDNPNTPEDESLLPYFNFMENRYAGSEWDFFLPGLGGPVTNASLLLQDGSGLLIWHIDENIITQNFTTNFDRNRINADATRKGVDLEEADGIQHLDTEIYSIYKWGSPFDSFRLDNNAYFGNQYHNSLLSLPTSESNYGGIPLEIYDISASGNQMTFSVRFRWSLDANYQGKNPFNAVYINFDNDDGDVSEELFYAMPDGQLYLWDNDALLPGFPMSRMPVVQYYTYCGTALYIPMEQQNLSRMYKLSPTNSQYVFSMPNSRWASHPVAHNSTLFLPVNKPSAENPDNYDNAVVYSFKITDNTYDEPLVLDNPICSNLVIFRNSLSLLQLDPTNGYLLTETDISTVNPVTRVLPVPSDSIIVALLRAPLNPKNNEGHYVVQCQNSVYVFDTALNLMEGYPVSYNLVSVSDSSHIAPLSIADVDGNGTLDLVISGEQGLMVIDYRGNRMSPESLYREADGEGIASGAIVTDIDGDGKVEIIGNQAMNQLFVHEHDFRMKSGFPVSYAQRSRNMPIIGRGDDSKWYLYTAADNGRIFRSNIPDAPANGSMFAGTGWRHEYADIFRSASIDPGVLPNQFESQDVFVPGQVYIYPNPLKSIYKQQLMLNLMTSVDTEVELSIYDISGGIVYRQKATARAYLKNLDIFSIPCEKLSSGVYIAVVKTPQSSKTIKFSVEK